MSKAETATLKKYSRKCRYRKGPFVRICRALTALALLALGASPASAALSNSYTRIAGDILRAAARHNCRRIAVLSFLDLSGENGAGGRVVAERLTEPLAQTGLVQVVERSLLDVVMREKRLEYSGALDPGSARALGAVLGADALITGIITPLRNDRVEIHARLIDIQTARVLAASSSQVEKDWAEPLAAGWNFQVPDPPALRQASLEIGDSSETGMPSGCHERIDTLDEKLLDLKARFWAERLKDGLHGGSLIQNPGSEIRNPELRSEFYSKLIRYSKRGEFQPLGPMELSLLRRGLEEARELNESCGGEP